MIMLASCRSYGTDFLERGIMQNEEWISFDVETVNQYKGECLRSVNCHVIFHNINDSVQEIALFTKDGSSFLITPEEMTHIDPHYGLIARFRKGHMNYYGCVGMPLHNYVHYLSMYYPLYDDYSVVLSDKARRKLWKGDTIYIIEGTKTVKYCYTNGTCELKDEKTTYLYSCRQRAFLHSRHSYAFRGRETSTITHIDLNDQRALIDSVFNLADKRYDGYERLAINEYYPHLIEYTRNTEMNDTILDFPLVNLASGDTTSLRQMQGTTLLYFYNFYLDNEYYSTVETLGRQVADNIIWLMPTSNNVERLNQMATGENLGSNLYYTKGLTRHLIADNHHQAYLIGPDHKTLSVFDRIETFEEWIQKLPPKS